MTNLFNDIENIVPEKQLNEYIRKYKNGNHKYRDIIINSHIRLVFQRVLKYFNNTPYDEEELISVGMLGLVKSLYGFDISKNIKFITYASKCIDNEILMFIRRSKRHLNVESIYKMISTDNEENKMTIEDTLYDETENIEEIYEKKETILELINIVEGLTESEKKLIYMSFGFNNSKQYTQQEIANELNISQPLVSRKLKKILMKIKNEIKIRERNTQNIITISQKGLSKSIYKK